MRARHLLAWIAAGVLGAFALAWAYPRVFPFAPHDWTIDQKQAIALALEKLRDLGDPVPDAYVTCALGGQTTTEFRLQREAERLGVEKVRSTPVARGMATYTVTVYPPQAGAGEWRYRAEVTPDGQFVALRLRLRPDDPGTAIEATKARAAADKFLTDEGFDLAQFREPQARSEQLLKRTDTHLRYRYHEQAFGESVPYGIEVTFAGERLAGYERYLDDPEERAFRAAEQPFVGLLFVRVLAVIVMTLIAAVPFLRRYHAGEIGVHRGLQILGLSFGLSVVMIAMSARGTTEGVGLGPLTRPQTALAWGAQIILLFFLPLAVSTFLSWSVGESLCRVRWGKKLAAFDALFQRRWDTATVARAALRGTALGLALAGTSFLAVWALQKQGVWASWDGNFGPWWPGTHWVGLGLLCFAVVFPLYSQLYGNLMLLSGVAHRFGRAVGLLVAAAVCGTTMWVSPLGVEVMGWNFALAIAFAAASGLIFLRYDILTSLVAAIVCGVAAQAVPLLQAHSPWIQFQGCLALFGAALPLILSIRYIASDQEFVYRYDDVPPHVRKIAERERQRVELETARGIQSSILPELPPQMNGVEIAHTYLPASEVGGDFYDVLALEDGRLALAVGDVAGHGVSSGLVMSMAKSALAVQVTFNPEVEAVFRTLNRTVYQSARKRLLTTLCYALLDPKRRELVFASAGHLFPYRVGQSGGVEALESVSYPLGVRGEIEVRSRTRRLDAGDALVLFSDGVIEGRREGTDDLFGFERLEQTLAKYAGESVEKLRDGILADLARFTGGGPREDDLTVLVLRVP